MYQLVIQLCKAGSIWCVLCCKRAQTLCTNVHCFTSLIWAKSKVNSQCIVSFIFYFSWSQILWCIILDQCCEICRHYQGQNIAWWYYHMAADPMIPFPCLLLCWTHRLWLDLYVPPLCCAQPFVLKAKCYTSCLLTYSLCIDRTRLSCAASLVLPHLVSCEDIRVVTLQCSRPLPLETQPTVCGTHVTLDQRTIFVMTNVNLLHV